INWYGITDVGDLLDGPNMKRYAVEWMGSIPNRFEIAERVSPLTHVRAGLPPILTIHGDADPTVPYQHAVRLHEELTNAGIPNQLHTVPGGRHGGFNREQTLAIFSTIREFLTAHGLATGGSTSSSGNPEEGVGVTWRSLSDDPVDLRGRRRWAGWARTSTAWGRGAGVPRTNSEPK
ncbi:MAG: prolyl oligopeptidase family serine peptidase, partial [Longimicrobiales bacterium]